jgi:metal-dependent amidase/aminoacylase/carboxypeptidase family protein
VATGCSYEIATVSPTYLELRQDSRLLSAYREAIAELGRPVIPTGLEGVRPLGSTDMGNVSHAMPVIHPLIGIDSGGAGTHEIEFAAAAASGSADRAVVDGAVALTATAVHAALDPVLRDELLQEHEQRTGGQPQTAGKKR